MPYLAQDIDNYSIFVYQVQQDISNFCRIWHKFIIRKLGENIHRRLHYRLLMRISDEKARNFTSRMRKICLECPAAGTANQHNVRSTAVGPVRINPLRYRKSKQRSQSRSMKGGLIMATTRIMPLHIGKGRTESQARSATLSTMRPIRKRRTMADLSPDLDVTAGSLMPSSCWQSVSTLPPPDGCAARMM